MFSVRVQLLFRNTEKKNFFKFVDLLRLIGIDIVQTIMSVSTLYFFPFSSYMQKNKHVFGLLKLCLQSETHFLN